MLKNKKPTVEQVLKAHEALDDLYLSIGFTPSIDERMGMKAWAITGNRKCVEVVFTTDAGEWCMVHHPFNKVRPLYLKAKK